MEEDMEITIINRTNADLDEYAAFFERIAANPSTVTIGALTDRQM